MAERTDVVTAFLRNRAEVLLLRRADDASTYPGRWAAVSGYVEGGDAVGTARIEVHEETGIADATLARVGRPLPVDDEEAGHRWRVHPFLFEVETRSVTTNEESAAHEWGHPTEALRRETVPCLWEAYDRVRPTPESIAADDEHGSAYLSVRALEWLRDEAAVAARDDAGWARAAEAAEALLEARPGMAALANRVNRAMAASDRSAAEVERAAVEGIERALRADADAAAEAADVLDGGTALTLSRSGTVLEALETGASAAIVAESRPAREGVGVAETLAGAGLDVTVCTDAAVGHLLAEREVDAVVVGADAVQPDGSVVNKTGTRLVALAAANEGVPCYAVAASDKVRGDEARHLETGDPAAVYDGEAPLEAVNPTFDVTPAALVDGVVTERGVLDADGVADLAETHRALAAWRPSGE